MERESKKRRPKAARERRLNRSADFDRALDGGRRFHGARLTLVAAPGEPAMARLGIIASARSGKAVDRNRFKRLVREYFRNHPAEFPAGSNFVVIAKRAHRHEPAAQVWNDLGRLAARARPRGSRGQ